MPAEHELHAVAPVPLWTQPAGQLGHADVPVDAWNVPAPQSLHEAWLPAFWYWPAPHWPQFDCPPLPCFHPAGQPTQPSLRWLVSLRYVPVPQFPQTTFAVVEHALVRFWPAPQLPHVAHDVCPACVW